MNIADVPVVLSIAGSDNSAGAGIQADLKTFSAMGSYGLTAVTCVVAEVPGKVAGVHPVPVEFLVLQIDLSFEAFPVAAVKTGMLYSQSMIVAVAECVKKWRAQSAGPVRLVVDPVMVASSGDRLLQEDAIDSYRKLLLPMADLVTPNLDEAEVLTGALIGSADELICAGKRLSKEYGTAFLMKGGHLKGPEAEDFLVVGEEVQHFSAPFVKDLETHGTGCTYAAAVTAGLAKGEPLAMAVGNAKAYLACAIEGIHRWNTPHGVTMALDHMAWRKGRDRGYP